MSEAARLAHDYASILNAMVRIAKARGLEDRGVDHGLACYQILEAAISDAAVWEVPLAQIGLEGFDTNDLLSARKKSGRQTADDKPNDQRSQETADWRQLLVDHLQHGVCREGARVKESGKRLCARLPSDTRGGDITSQGAEGAAR